MSPRQRRVRLLLGVLCVLAATVIAIVALSGGGSTDLGELSRGTPRAEPTIAVPDGKLTDGQRADLEAAQKEAIAKSSDGQAVVSPAAMAAFTARFSERMVTLSDEFSTGAVKVEAQAVATWIRTQEPGARVVVETSPSMDGYADSWYVRDIPVSATSAEPSVEIGLGLPSGERLTRQLPSIAQEGTAPEDKRGT